MIEELFNNFFKITLYRVIDILKIPVIPLETMVQCPIDPNHKLKGKRMSSHLTRCLKNFPNHNFKVCSFNALHILTEENFELHLRECPNKKQNENEEIIIDKNEDVYDKETVKMEIFESMSFLKNHRPINKINLLKELSRPFYPFLSKNPYKKGILKYIEKYPYKSFCKLANNSLNKKVDFFKINENEIKQNFVIQPLCEEIFKQNII